MKSIKKHIQNQLEDDADLIDPALIDSSLSYQEQKEELKQYITPLETTQQKHTNIIRGQSYKALKQQNDAYDIQAHRITMRRLWKYMRKKHRQLKKKTTTALMGA